MSFWKTKGATKAPKERMAEASKVSIEEAIHMGTDLDTQLEELSASIIADDTLYGRAVVQHKQMVEVVDRGEKAFEQGFLDGAKAIAKSVDDEVLKRLLEEAEDMGFAEDTLKEIRSRGSGSGPAVKTSGEPIELLVDGDLVAYRAAAATEGTYYTVTVPMPKQKLYKDCKYHKEAVKYKEDQEAAGYTGITIEKRTKPEPLAHAVNNLKRTMEQSIALLEAEHKRPVSVSVYLTADSLFRDDVSPTYKKSREGQKRPTNLKGCKEFLEKNYGAETINGYEADDLIAIQHTLLNGHDCVVMSLDKDLRQLPGWHFDFVKREFYSVTEDKARLNFWTQVLVGDSTDDIKGLKGVGPVNAHRILEPHWGKDDHAYYKACIDAYMEYLPQEKDESKKAYLSRILRDIGKACRLLYLCREPELLWDVPLPSVTNDTKEAV